MNFKKSMIQNEYIIPKIFHLIWVGGQLREEYLEHLRYFSRIGKNSGYAIKIWVDTSSYFENRDRLFDIEHLSVCHTEDLLLRFVEAQDSGYTEQEKENFIKSIYFEYLSPPNYAAVSDFLRIEILRQEGGIYLDTDTMLHAYTEQKDIFLDIDFSIINKVGIAHTDRNNNLIVASQNHPALVACGKMMIDRTTEPHSLSEEEYSKIIEEYRTAKTNEERIQADKEIKKYFKNEHCWRMAKKSLHIMPYDTIGHNIDPYAQWRYEQSLMLKLSYASLRWHFTVAIGPETLYKTVIAWQNFLENQNIVSTYECFNVMLPLEKYFNTQRCDSNWCSEDTFTYMGTVEELVPRNSEHETAALENAVSLFEERVLPLTFSDLCGKLYHFPENVITQAQRTVKSALKF